MAIVGASLGANLAALVAADDPVTPAIALISPSLDYRGLRLDPSFAQETRRPADVAGGEHRGSLCVAHGQGARRRRVGREQRLSSVRGHGTQLLAGDPDLARALVDWLRARLIF